MPPNAAFLSQVPQLISDSVADNVGLGPVVRRALAAALELAAIADDIDRDARRRATLIGPRGLRLSGGQRQRLATARALVHSPELVVLDDLSSALDVETELELWRNLADAGMTVLAVSHRAVAFERADQVITLAHPSDAARSGRAQVCALAGAVVGGVGAAGAAGVRAEPARAVAGGVVVEVVAVARRAATEALRAVVAQLLGQRHEDVGDHLVVEARRRRGPVDVQRRAVVCHGRRRDRQPGDLGVDPLHGVVDRCVGQRAEPVEQGAHPLVDARRPRRRRCRRRRG